MLIAILDADVLFPGTGPLRRVPHPARVQAAERSVFLFGFAKSDQNNIDAGELKVLRKAAAEMLGWSEKQVAAMLASGAWTEVNDEREEVQK